MPMGDQHPTLGSGVVTLFIGFLKQVYMCVCVCVCVCVWVGMVCMVCVWYVLGGYVWVAFSVCEMYSERCVWCV